MLRPEDVKPDTILMFRARELPSRARRNFRLMSDDFVEIDRLLARALQALARVGTLVSIEGEAHAYSLFVQALNSGLAAAQLLQMGLVYDALVCTRTSLESSWRAIHIAGDRDAFERWKRREDVKIGASRRFACSALREMLPDGDRQSEELYRRLSEFAHAQAGTAASASLRDGAFILGGVSMDANPNMYKWAAIMISYSACTIAAGAECCVWRRPEHVALWEPEENRS